MGLFTWVYNKAVAAYNYVYNFIISCIYPNNITQTTQPAPIHIPEQTTLPQQEAAPAEVVADAPQVAEMQPSPVAEEDPEHPVQKYTITDENEDEIFTSLQQNNEIVSVSFENHILDQQYETLLYKDPLSNSNSRLAMFMLNTTQLRNLYLNGVGIDTAGLQTLANILSNKNCHLESLNIANNNRNGTKGRRDTGFMKLFEALGKNNTLKSINLRRTNITYHMDSWIADCLKKNFTLKKIDLSYNKLYARSVNTIIQAIAKNINSAVTYISLVDNNIYEYEEINTDYSFNRGTKEQVYDHINEISATKNAINLNRDERPRFLLFTERVSLKIIKKETDLHDNCISKIGEMLLGSNRIRRDINAPKSKLNEVNNSLAIYCPAPVTWDGPKIR